MKKTIISTLGLVIILAGCGQGTTNTNQTTTPQPEVKKELYFGLGLRGDEVEDQGYSLVNLANGEAQDFLPSKYIIIDQHKYPTLPEYLILSKDNSLYSYLVAEKTFTIIDISLKDSEITKVYPSISEKDKFYFEIFDTIKTVPGMHGDRKAVSRTEYFYDAKNNKLEMTAEDIGLPFNELFFSGCYEYDSKYSRLFSWPCGEGIGNSIPLETYDLVKNESEEIVSLDEFSIKDNQKGFVSVTYNNGQFLMIPKNIKHFFEIMVVRPTKEITKHKFTITEKVRTDIIADQKNPQDPAPTYPYSAIFAPEQKTIVIGGQHEFSFLLYNNNNEIYDIKTVKEEKVYANFTFVHQGKIYYLVNKNIKVLDIATQQVEKSFPVDIIGEITLFYF